jgi:hypothetical protein
LTEIWVPYGPVEVSFDVRQENLSQILDPQPKKISNGELEQKAVETAGSEAVLILSSSNGTAQVLDTLLSKNKGIKKLLHTKQSASLTRRKAQENQIPVVEEVNIEKAIEVGEIDGTPSKIITEVRNASNLLVLTSVHYDPLFGITSAASDLASLVPEMKREAFNRSANDLPCMPTKSEASLYMTRVLQSFPNVSCLEVIERAGIGVMNFFSGEPEATHAKVVDFWKNNLKIDVSSRAERIIFGSGGGESDKTLSDAFARAFFNIANNLALEDSGAKLCMLAECAQGLGSEALLRYVTGRLEPRAKLDEIRYVDGLEVLVSFFKIPGDLELSMISTLPKYYGEKFGFKMYSGAREAPFALVGAGSRGKISVVPDGSSAAFSGAFPN